MDKTIKKKWIKALRGHSPLGVYHQGQFKLSGTKEDGTHTFCCLGVLQNEVMGFDRRGCRNIMCAKVDDPDLNVSFLDKVGLSSEDEYNLIELNDCKNYDFNEIADWVDEHL